MGPIQIHHRLRLAGREEEAVDLGRETLIEESLDELRPPSYLDAVPGARRLSGGEGNGWSMHEVREEQQ